jgi:hypothetical protein
VYSQTEKKKAEKYLEERGELVFTFTANNLKEVRELAKLISFDHDQDPSNPLVINANVNQKEFQKFLEFDLPYLVKKEKNERGKVKMYNSSSNRADVLTFPIATYPTFDDYKTQMENFETDNPLIAELVNIGSSENGKELLFIKLSDNVTVHEQEPRIMLTSSMHGDETAGFPTTLTLIDFLIKTYNDPGHARYTEIKNLIDNSEIWINPMANPDGTYFGDWGSFVGGEWDGYDDPSGSRRRNANNVDLNRNYPDPVGGAHPDGEVYQAETIAFMAMADSYHFVLSANMHGGVEVINYPWDTWSVAQGRHVDDDWFKLISTEYAVHAQTDSPSGYFDYNVDPNAPAGVTHGATWYQVEGGRQDYMNYEHQCRETTFELSDEKHDTLDPSTGNPDALLDYWDYNQDALIDYLKQGTYGFTGLVKDAGTLNPIQAKITIVGRDDIATSRGSWVNTELPIGDYYRPIEAGTYDILFEADCYQPFTLTGQTIADGTTVNLADVLLTPISPSVPNSLSATSITTTTATINWSTATGGESYDIRYRINGAGTWINTTSTTTSFDFTGLDIDTTYEYQVRGVCGASTSAYSTTETFTTLSVSYCVSSGNSDWDTGVTQVSFNTLLKVDLDNKNNSGYDDFTAEGGASTTTVIQGSPYTLSVNVDTDGAYTIHAFAWIDFNGDGDFNDDDETYDLGDANGVSNGTTDIEPSILIPTDGAIGPIRMRVAARYSSNPSSCGTGYDGEVEDYTINIEAVLGVENELDVLNAINIYPNPASDQVFVSLPNTIELLDYRISNTIGQVVFQDKPNNTSTIDVSSMNSGIYFLTLNTDKGELVRKIIIN